ncbi:class I SAM-dependent DNA methyltransferase [Sulfitobacter sp.]|uniref:class I SAM-dependent DNA methyltransferase n=1 Tax=Sulfitobacter sp. TaxID=1903071 RepID=UPI003002ECD8
MSTNFLDKAYVARDSDSTRALYNEWSATYEAEVGAHGYAAPTRCAEALAACVVDKTTPLLDFGCGTGLAGLAFRLAGFEVIDGVDISAEMLEQARAKNIYRTLKQIEPDAKLDGNYTLISAVGVIGAGAAPPSTLDTLLHALSRDGKLVFSFNDHALADSANTGRLNEWLDCGAARLLSMDHGPHMPGKNLNSTVYVVEKA